MHISLEPHSYFSICKDYCKGLLTGVDPNAGGLNWRDLRPIKAKNTTNQSHRLQTSWLFLKMPHLRGPLYSNLLLFINTRHILGKRL